MKILNDKPLVILTWDELCEMMDEIPIDRLHQLSWFKWNMGGIDGLDKKSIDLYGSIFREIESQV